MLPTDLILKVKASHFLHANFKNCNLCPLSEAAKEQFKTSQVLELKVAIEIFGKTYAHRKYDLEDYYKDYDLAVVHDFDDTIIRQIELAPIIKEKI